MSIAEELGSNDVDEATVTLRGGEHTMPVRSGTMGPDVIDITSL